MGFELSGETIVTNVSGEKAPSGCLPSVDPMFASLAHIYDGQVLGVVLSGMGRDGLQGAKELVEAGGAIIAQDVESSAVWGMPGAVVNSGLASACLPPEDIVDAITAAAGAMAWT